MNETMQDIIEQYRDEEISAEEAIARMKELGYWDHAILEVMAKVFPVT